VTATKPVVERDGWVIRQQYELPRSPTGAVGVSWWEGPSHGWGTTWSSIIVRASYADGADPDEMRQDRMVEVWPTKAKALEAHRAVYRGQAGRRNPAQPVTAQRVADAIDEAWARHLEWMARRDQQAGR